MRKQEEQETDPTKEPTKEEPQESEESSGDYDLFKELTEDELPQNQQPQESTKAKNPEDKTETNDNAATKQKFKDGVSIEKEIDKDEDEPAKNWTYKEFNKEFE